MKPRARRTDVNRTLAEWRRPVFRDSDKRTADLLANRKADESVKDAVIRAGIEEVWQRTPWRRRLRKQGDK